MKCKCLLIKIDKLSFTDPLNAQEYLEVDNNEVINEMASDAKIVALVKNLILMILMMMTPMIISHFQALTAFDTCILYLEQQPDEFNLNVKDLHIIKDLRKKVSRECTNARKQMTLDGFLG